MVIITIVITAVRRPNNMVKYNRLLCRRDRVVGRGEKM